MATRLEGPSVDLAHPRASTSETLIQTEPSLGELFRELAQDTSDLVRKEMDLARAELRDNVRSTTRHAGMMAIGGGVLLVSGLVFTAFLVAGLGELLGDAYWLSALLVGAVYAIVGGLLVARGRRGLEGETMKPDRAIAALQDDGRWARAELQQMKRDLTR